MSYIKYCCSIIKNNYWPRHVFYRIQHYPGNRNTLPTSKAELHDAAYATNEIYLNYFNKLADGALSDMIPVGQDTLNFALIPIYLRKQSNLKARLDGLVLRFTSSGLIKKWKADYGRATNIRRKIDKFPQPLAFGQLSGVFIICGSIYCIIIVIFLLELWSKRANHRHIYAMRSSE